MLTTLRLGNFKAFGEGQRVPLKPITLVFGPNSAGKSSLIHSLAMAHEARRSGNLDIFRTEVGGTAIDLGGFRQYVFRRDIGRRVEWAAEIDVARISGRLGELLAPVKTVGVSVTFGIPLNDVGAPTQPHPSVGTYEIEADGTTLLRMSGRRDGKLRVDRLSVEHPVFRQVLKAIIESATTTEIRPEDQDTLDNAVADLVPKLTAKSGSFLPTGLEMQTDWGQGAPSQSMLFPVGRGSRSQDLSEAVGFYLPRIVNELIEGLGGIIGGELDRFQYLGPLRSFPPRHLAFMDNHDPNWRAGGGHAWEVLLRNAEVRGQVNKWLGADWLQTKYQLTTQELVPIEQLHQPVSEAIDMIQDDQLDLDVDYDDTDGQPSGNIPIFKDPEEAVSTILTAIANTEGDLYPELILKDLRTDTMVSHRDVGIGVSQVLPVLVSAYGSRDNIVAIEQPEIHLHPALQAELGDVFIQSALGDQGNTFILETHSEHLILRIMRRIRDTADEKLPTDLPHVRPEDVSVLYVEPTKSGAIVRVLELDDDGEFLDPWPGGFFEEGFKERFS